MSSKLVRQAIRLLLSTVMVSVGLWTLPVQAQQGVSDDQVKALVEALRNAAPQTGTANDGLYSDWQIKPENIPRWSRLCTGRELTPAQFESSLATAREILVCVMRDVLRDEYKASGSNEAVAVQRAASWWMTGDPSRYNSAPTNSYTQKVLGFYQQQRRSPQSRQPATPPQQPAAKPSTLPTPSSSSPSQISDDQVKALVEALRNAAPQTGTANDGLYSDWQIKPENIPRWSRLCTGRELTPVQFESSPATAREILACVMRDVLRDEYKASGNNEAVAVQRAASWWMTGDPNQYNSAPTNSYTQKVLGFYQQQRRSPQSQQPTTSPQQSAAKPSTQPPTNQPQPARQPSSPQQSAAKPSTQPPANQPQPAPQPSSQQSSGQPTARSSSPSQIADAQVGALVEALRQAAPQTGTENDELYSDWQVKSENIPRWSKQCTGQELTPKQFQDSPVTARAILVCVMRDVLREQYTASSNNEVVAVQRAASWWMTGDPNQYSSASTAPYTQKVLDFYQQSRLKFFSHI
jgi:outer membrane biosynthesis protein TonB